MPSQLDAIIEILRRIPEKRLLIIELANKTPRIHGDFDTSYLLDIQDEIKLAITEAKRYSKHTDEAVEMLTRVPGNSEGPRIRTITAEEFVQGFEF